MFWALVMTPGKTYSRTVENDVMVTMAALGEPAPAAAVSKKDKASGCSTIQMSTQQQNGVICHFLLSLLKQPGWLQSHSVEYSWVHFYIASPEDLCRY